jgi:hypothetical protein
MDEVARRNTEEREEVFAIAADSLGVPSIVVEKDFWVCWTLGRLFSSRLIAAIGAGADGAALTDRLLFKGGTSLSKVYGAIDRFSEDIDITVDRAFLGIEGPRAADSRKKRDRLREEVERACHGFVNNQLRAALLGILRIELAADDDWRLDSDPNAGEPTLVFRFPTTSSTTDRYLMPAIRIEVGARGAHEPAENAQVTPMAARAVPQVFSEPGAPVRVMSAARTFWEKATLLHMLHHRGAPIGQRHARHYFDMHQLADHPLGRAACADRALLRRVIDHRELMDPTPTARCGEAAKGLIRLAPRPEQLPSLEQDYRAMRDMFLTEPPALAEIVARLRRLEEEING